MDLKEIASLAIDEAFDGVESVAEDAEGVGTPTAKPAQTPPNPIASRLEQTLQEHDQQYHGGHYDGGECNFRDKVAAQAKQFGVADKVSNLGREANKIDNRGVGESAEWQQYKQDRGVQDATFAERLKASGVENPQLNGTGYNEEQMKIVDEWHKAIDERRDKYLKDTLGEAESHCVEQLATLIDAGGEKGEKALKLAEEISQKYPEGDPRHDGAEKMKDRAERKKQKDEYEQRMADLEAKEKALKEQQEAFEKQQKEAEKAAKQAKRNGGSGDAPLADNETRIGDKTYVDVSGMGFFKGMKEAFKAGYAGKDIVTDWDKMSGRWDKMLKDTPESHKGNMGALQDAMKHVFEEQLFTDAFDNDTLDNGQKAQVSALYNAWKDATPSQKPKFIKQMNDFMARAVQPKEEEKDEFDSGNLSSLSNSYQGNAPDTSIYEEIPADERDTSFMDEKKQQIEDALRDARINATITNAVNGPSVVQFDIQRADNGTGNALANVLSSLQQDLGVTITYEPDIKSGKQRFGHIRINNPTSRDAGMRRLLEHPSTKKQTEKMSAPFLAGETPEGEPVWMDLTDHGFMGGDSGSGKSERVRGGLAGAYHVKTPNQLQVLVNAHANSADYAHLEDDPHTAGIAKTTDEVIQNLSNAAAEWKRREKLFKENGVQNLKDYNDKMRAEGHAENQLPQLLVVTDEATNLLAERPEATDIIRDIVTNGRKFGVSHFGVTQDMRADNIPTDLKGSARMGVQSNEGPASRMIFGENVPELRSIERMGGMMVKTPDGIKRIRGTYAGKENLKRLAEYNKSHYAKGGAANAQPAAQPQTTTTPPTAPVNAAPSSQPPAQPQQPSPLEQPQTPTQAAPTEQNNERPAVMPTRVRNGRFRGYAPNTVVTTADGKKFKRLSEDIHDATGQFTEPAWEEVGTGRKVGQSFVESSSGHKDLNVTDFEHPADTIRQPEQQPSNPRKTQRIVVTPEMLARSNNGRGLNIRRPAQ